MYVASTRFNNRTIEENRLYREKNNISGVIYSTNIRIRETYALGALFYVVEMNNDTNKIEGIGLIRNRLILDKKHSIYTIHDYNRFVYTGKYFLSRDYLLELAGELVELFDQILFKGRGHLKRQSGISVITDKIFMKKGRTSFEIRRRLASLFGGICIDKD